MSVPTISAQETRTLKDTDSALLVDVRSVGEALEESIPGSVFVPFDLVSPERLEQLGAKDKDVVFVCRSGVRAQQAASAVAGVLDGVKVLDGGIEKWKSLNLPVAQGRKAMPLERQVLVGAGTMIFLFTMFGLIISPIFLYIVLAMCASMVFAGFTGACGMARILLLMPWNKAPLCGGTCKVPSRK